MATALQKIVPLGHAWGLNGARHVAVRMLRDRGYADDAAAALEAEAELWARTGGRLVDYVLALTLPRPEAATGDRPPPTKADDEQVPMDHVEAVLAREMDRFDFDMDAFKSRIRCKYCHRTDKMVVRHEQRRSADEGATEIWRCGHCEREWVGS